MTDLENLQITAHRGIGETYPENTIPAFRAAAALPVYAIEFDAHLTRDGVLVVTHDDTIGRCSNGSGRVGDHTYRELRQLDFGSWKDSRFAGTRIPTLEETVHAILSVNPAMRMLMEVKEDDIACAEAMLDFIRKHDLFGQTMMTSFSPAVLTFLRTHGGPDLKLHGSDKDGALLNASEGKSLLDSVGIHHSLVTRESVARYHQMGIRVDAWVLDDLPGILQVCECGVDGITTNAADRIIRELTGCQAGS